MAGDRITVRVDGTLHERIQVVAATAGKPESEIVRDALDSYLTQHAPVSCFDLAEKLGIIGCVTGGPSDVSTNSKHLDGFGRE